jgi:hypothetical protein
MTTVQRAAVMTIGLVVIGIAIAAPK